jgi:conjugative transfer signal peptidase TraF
MTRFAWVMITSFTVLGIGISTDFRPAPRLIWNATASTPIGLYALFAANKLNVGDLVAIIPPEPTAAFLAEGEYLPKNVLLLKHVAALQGQTVCRRNRTIMINGRAVGEAVDYDSRGRPLPIWQGCHVLAAGELFIMNDHVPESLDGRYFGPFPASAVIGHAVPLWTEDDTPASSGKHATDH